jgi:hypothetical protein
MRIALDPGRVRTTRRNSLTYVRGSVMQLDKLNTERKRGVFPADILQLFVRILLMSL